MRVPPEARIDWRPLLDPRGRYSALVTTGSSPDRVRRHCSGLVYLCAPYVHEAQIRGVWRVERSVRISVLASVERARLAACGVTALCPAIDIAEIAHARVLVDDAPEPLDMTYWRAWSQPILNVAALLAVPEIPGWDRCPLVWRDLRFALAQNVPVHVYSEP
ncbi:DUF1937 family protein [Cereibacter sphaeroides]|nr:DUF1937 family protein [Cereibacter sphaeroides]